MADINDLVIRLDATTEQLRRELTKADRAVVGFERQTDRQLKKIDQRFAAMAANTTKVMLRFSGVIAAAFGSRAIIRATVEQEKVVAQLNATIRSTGMAAGASQKEMNALSGELQRYAAQLQKTTTFGDEAIISSQALLLTFRQIGTDTMPRAQKAILDLSQAMQMDLRSATLQVGKALNDPILGVTALRRSGIQLTESQQDLIKSFVEVGDVAKAQTIILEELENQFGGSAEAARNTLGGALSALTNNFGDFLEVIGQTAQANTPLLELINNLADGFALLGEEINIARGNLEALSDEVITTELFKATRDLIDLRREMQQIPMGLRIDRDGREISIEDDPEIRALNEKINLYETTIKQRAEDRKSIERLNVRIKENSAAEAEAAKRKKESEAALKKLTSQREKSAAVQRRIEERKQEFIANLAEETHQYIRLNEALNLSTEAYEKEERRIRAHNEVKRRGFILGTQEYEQVLRQVEARDRLKDSIDETIKRREEEQRKLEAQQREMERILAEPFINASNNVQNEIARMLENWDFSMRGFVQIAKRAGAEAAAALIVRPVLQSAITGNSGVGGGLGSISSAGDVLSLFKGLNSGGMSLSGTAIGRGIDSVGASLGLSNSQFIGPMPAGQTAGISGGFTAGSALAGFAGNMGANLLLGDRGMGASIGGAAGGLAGTAIGANMGTILGFAGGPAGALIGAFAGNALGGLFGGGRKHPASNFAFDQLGDGQAQLFSKHVGTETADALSQAVGGIAQMLMTAGIDVAAQTVQGGVDDGRGFFAIGRQGLQQSIASGIRFNPNDEQDVQRALGDLAIQLARTAAGSDAISVALGNISTKGRDAEEVLTDIMFALEFNKIGDVPPVLSEIEQGIAELREVFQAAADTAARLGLEVAKVTEAERKRMDLLRGQFVQGIAQQILQAAAPQELAVLNERQRFAAQQRDLRALGASQQELQMAELLHNINMQNILQENNGLQEEALQREQERLRLATDTQRRFERLQQSFSNIIQELTLGRFSPLDPVTRLGAMRDQVTSLGRRAAIGDVEAGEELAQLLPEFVRLSGEINGFNATFEQDRAMAESLARNTLSVAERQVSLQQRIIDEAQRQTAALQNGFGRLEQVLQQFGSNISASQIMAAAGGTNANDVIVRAISQGRLSESIAHEIIRSSGFGGSIGDGNVQRFFAGNNQANMIAVQELQRRGIQAFNSGGLVGGRSGVDQNMILASKGEFVMSNAAVDAIGEPAMRAMNSGRVLPIDFSPVTNGLKSVENALHSLQRTVAAGESMTIEQISAMRGEVAQISNVATRIAVGT